MTRNEHIQNFLATSSMYLQLPPQWPQAELEEELIELLEALNQVAGPGLCPDQQLV